MKNIKKEVLSFITCNGSGETGIHECMKLVFQLKRDLDQQSCEYDVNLLLY